MFQLEEISLRNFKIHRKLDVSFTQGINVIVGDNGCGKSSLIRAIEFVNTGKTSLDKADLITAGETSGYVREKFQLFGKPGTIERHLDTSKVVLEYDGKKYLKSSEVAEIWDSLLQIDGHIFSNVIIAHQKQIPLLFNGLDAIREKIFHKIFMVPPTDKIRKIIWDKYITKCPPPRPEENILEIESRMSELVVQINPLQEKLDLLVSSLLTDEQYSGILSYLSNLQQCKTDELAYPALAGQLAAGTDKCMLLEDVVTSKVAAMAGVDIQQLTTARDTLLSNKRIAGLRQKAVESLELYTSVSPGYERAMTLRSVQESLVTATSELAAANDIRAAAKHDESVRVAALAQFATLTGKEACPTCKQSLTDMKAYLEDLNTQRDTAVQAHKDAQIVYTKAVALHAKCQAALTTAKKSVDDLAAAEALVNSYEDVSFDQAQLDEITAVISAFSADKDAHTTAVNQLKVERQKIVTLETKIAALRAYTGETSIDEETQQLNEVVAANKENLRQKDAAQAELAKLNAEVAMLQNRIENTNANKVINGKRDNYLGLLQQAYDVLHNSQFPRALTQSYSQLVEEELSIQLSNFQLPYRAKIGEAFKIHMINSEGLVMPEVSGGQEMIIGMCLRMALHTLFSSSFPLIIIDEGTTHLQEKNVRAYFDFLTEIKNKSNIKQIIAIDHNEGIQSVADHVIHL